MGVEVSMGRASILGDAFDGGRLGMSLCVSPSPVPAGMPKKAASEGVQLSSISEPWSNLPADHTPHRRVLRSGVSPVAGRSRLVGGMLEGEDSIVLDCGQAQL